MLQSDRSKFDAMSDEAKKAQIAKYNNWVGGLVEKNQFKKDEVLNERIETIKKLYPLKLSEAEPDKD